MLRSRLVPVLLTVLAVIPVSAQIVGLRSAPLTRFIPCPRPAKLVTVDGYLKEWDLTRAPIILSQESLKTWGYSDPPITSDQDASARALLAWDDKGMYFAGDVTDNAVIGLPAPNEKRGPMWQYDGFMLMFFPTPALLADKARYLDRPDDIGRMRQWGLNYHEPGGQGRQHREEITYVTRKTDRGYVVEALLPWKALGFAPRVGDRYRLNIIMPDHDETTPYAPGWGQLIWASGPTNTTTGERYAAEVRLLDDRKVGAEIVPARTQVTTDEAVELQVLADALAPGAKFQQVTAKDAQGKELWRETVGRELPANERTTLSARIPAGTLPEGIVTLAAVVVPAGGKETTPSVPIKVTSAQVIQQVAIPGEWPEISASADPSRYALPGADQVYLRRQWAPVTKEDYYHLAVALSGDPNRLPAKPPEEVAAGPHPWGYMNAVYALGRYVHDQDPQMLAMTKAIMQSSYMYEKKVAGADPPDSTGVLSYAELWHWWFYLKDNNLLTAEDDAWLRDFVLLNARRFVTAHRGFSQREYGAHNRTFAWAMVLDGAMAVDPNLPEKAQWKPYTDEIWNSWWPYRDTEENSDGYSMGVVANVLPDWGRIRGVDVLRDPGWQQLAGRWLAEISPAGMRPNYGDGSAFNGTGIGMIPLLERLAVLTGDGRYKWAAHRLFEWATVNTRDWTTWHLAQDSVASALFWAYLYADDTIAEKVPENNSVLTTRKLANATPLTVRSEQKKWYEMTDRDIPNKLALRSGNGRLDLWALVELCPSLGHSLGVAPNIACLASNYSALLTDQSYMDRGPEFHNVMTVEDLEGLAATGAEEQISVPDFGETGMAAYAAIDVDLYRGWPIKHRRQIVLVKNVLMWVKDDATFQDGFLCRVGPRWHTRQIFPKVGENWANTFIDFHLSTGLGLGSGLHRTENPNYDLLIWFVPQKGCRVTHLDRSRTNIWQALPQQLHYAWEGLAQPGQKLSFGTILWPHPPDRDPTKWANNLEALTNSPDLSAVRVKITDDLAYLMVLNDTGQSRMAGPITTDARLTVLTVRKGKPETVMVYQGAKVTYEGKAVLALDKPDTTQKAVQ